MTEENQPTERDAMFNMLCSVASGAYINDGLFHGRCQIAVSAAAYALHRMGQRIDKDQYAVAMQAAAVALVLAQVPDDELAESLDMGKVMISQLEFSRARDYLIEQQMAGEDES